MTLGLTIGTTTTNTTKDTGDIVFNNSAPTDTMHTQEQYEYHKDSSSANQHKKNLFEKETGLMKKPGLEKNKPNKHSRAPSRAETSTSIKVDNETPEVQQQGSLQVAEIRLEPFDIPLPNLDVPIPPERQEEIYEVTRQLQTTSTMADINTLMREMIEALQKANEHASTPKPQKFDGTQQIQDFLKDCDIYFKGKDTTKDAKKILFVLNNTEKKPHNWCRTKFDKYETSMAWPTWTKFKEDFAKAFQKVDSEVDAIVKLDRIMQADFDSVNDYNIEFNQLVKEAKYNNPSTDTYLQCTYTGGLKSVLAKTLIQREKKPTTLQRWQEEALKLDNAEIEWDKLRRGRQRKDWQNYLSLRRK
ncbi:uncharacterized protein PHACADRAFT_192196 [Phanerochaete carnosa HHB-10118-sp]|uniref:Ty3 transposon capsid-like protein domain-containing protein n=1 Tax=Phanerochaete carnosa (strain HHB-10118-sp) TaxID=650164 RepID=K5XA97_PHACS|nr:uncharacterized protein PHACADRAFT_192196 [Phanerochaete carnosa HHB-10118-sp]EKM59822.1 hypothetical protein PHACADRAFT_192196 [Phanerochaete carnosa HHB-10118-sp]